MADEFDWGDFFENVAEAAVAIATAYAANELQIALAGGRQKAGSQSAHIAIKQPVPPDILGVGDHDRVAPQWVFFESKDNAIGEVRCISREPIDTDIDGIWLFDDVVTLGGDGRVITVNGSGDGPYMDDPNPRVTIFLRYGAATETAYEPITSRWGDIWTSSHRGNGCASLAMLCFAPEAKFFREAFPNGKPEVTLAPRWLCYDWRDPGQDRDDIYSWGWCDNPVVWAVHCEWYRWGEVAWDAHIAPVLDALTAEADYCDDLVATQAGYEKRYRLRGHYKANESNDSVRQRIKAAMDGWWTRDGQGRLVIKAGRYEEPTITLTDKDITGFSWSSGVPTEIRADQLNVSFTSPEANYVQTECDPWIVNAEGSEADDFYVPWCGSFPQARRLAKRYAARTFAQHSGSFTVGAVGYRCWGQRYVRIDHSRLGNFVIELPDGVERQDSGSFTFRAVQVSAAIDAWNPATEEGADPGVVDRPAYESLDAPVIGTAEDPDDGVTVFTDGLGTRLTIEATGPDREDLTWFYRWQLDGDAAWFEFADTTVSGGSVTMTTGAVAAGETLNVQASYRAGTTQSPWSDSTQVET